jgi:cytochrome c peroxidase
MYYPTYLFLWIKKMNLPRITLLITPVFSLLIASSPPPIHAEAFGPMPIALNNLSVPNVPGLLDGPDPVVINKDAAIILGKALFWDTNVGSDGMACGSCHFHAGADRRTKNQLHPGGKSTSVENQLFNLSAANTETGPNHTLTKSLFPFHQRQEPLNHISPVIYNNDDVVSSAGTFSGQFNSAERTGTGIDDCSRNADAIFHVGGNGVRLVQSRNTPTVINAIFNHRSFLDGRANNAFNGSSPWGDRDPNAGVWVKVNSRTVNKQRLNLINSSLASLAVAPPVSTSEMSCQNRTFPNIGRKLLMRRPLGLQKVHWNDSVLGSLSLSSPGDLQPGLNTTYTQLVKQAFNKKYWSYRRRGAFGKPTGELAYNQMEANFAMFFGLAIQLYESTLISDQSPFDQSARDSNNVPIDLTASEQNGLDQFRDNECVICHIGPNFTTASVNANAAITQTHPETFGDNFTHMSTSTNVVNRVLITTSGAYFDNGFASTGVAELSSDIGLGGTDPFGNPLSFSPQYLQHLAGNNAAVVDNDVMNVRSCDFQLPIAINYDPGFATSLFTPADGVLPQPQSTENCYLPLTQAYIPTPAAALAELNNPSTVKMVTAVNGAFKIPSLRNIELTGPYMHNGGMATLEEVIEFYTRGGNFHHHDKQIDKVFPLFNLQFSPQNRADLIAFLKTLTDDRVRNEKAPFDHPEIKISHGHVGDNFSITASSPLSPGLAEDEFITLEAIGAAGRATPILPFENYMAP